MSRESLDEKLKKAAVIPFAQAATGHRIPEYV